ncbi:hypothetical protein [Liquorilactobacillus vini]|uniref:hypothetical protein n=1 Tax=Liquorilactobacillus vini TaxID=238015 RepID=UPI00054E55CA|nr:hypothetical protein [Liquorilactobacillus vini]
MVHGEFKILEPRFNAISSYFEMSYDELLIYRKPVNFYSAEQIKTAVDDPIIVHFTSTFLCNRPWQEGSSHPFKKQWIKRISSYQKAIQIKNISLKQKNLKIFFYLLPRRASICLFGVLQAYVRPMFLRMKL